MWVTSLLHITFLSIIVIVLSTMVLKLWTAATVEEWVIKISTLHWHPWSSMGFQLVQGIGFVIAICSVVIALNSKFNGLRGPTHNQSVMLACLLL